MENVDKTAFWVYLGQGICVFLACLGIGTCSMLMNSKIIIEEPKVEKVVNP